MRSGRCPTSSSTACSTPPIPKGALNYWKSNFLAELSDDGHRHDDRVLRAMSDPDGPAAARARPRRRDPGRGRRHGLSAPRGGLQLPRALRNGWSRATPTRALPGRARPMRRCSPSCASGRYVNYLGDDETGRSGRRRVRSQLPAAAGDQDQVRSEELLPHEPEHPAIGLKLGRAMPLLYRPARAQDLQRAGELVVGSINDLCERHGFGPMAAVRPPNFSALSRVTTRTAFGWPKMAAKSWASLSVGFVATYGSWRSYSCLLVNKGAASARSC